MPVDLNREPRDLTVMLSGDDLATVRFAVSPIHHLLIVCSMREHSVIRDEVPGSG